MPLPNTFQGFWNLKLLRSKYFTGLKKHSEPEIKKFTNKARKNHTYKIVAILQTNQGISIKTQQGGKFNSFLHKSNVIRIAFSGIFCDPYIVLINGAKSK